MSTRITTLVFIGLAVVSRGQTGVTFSNQLLDASNSEMTLTAGRSVHSNPPQATLPGSISVRELEHPLAGKYVRILLKAQQLMDSGDAARGKEQLRQAMKDPVAEPYALAIMGADLLKRGDADSAIPVLESAVRMLPGVAASHSNLAWALSLRGRNEEALKEARKALQLDPGHSRYRYVLGLVLLRLDQREEAEFHLRKASPEIAGARTVLERSFRP